MQHIVSPPMSSVFTCTSTHARAEKHGGKIAALALADGMRLIHVCHRLHATHGAGDPTLAMWSKREEPVLPMPPPDMPLVGWRDPFIFEIKGKQGNGREWGMLMGSGLKGQGGAIMIYRSENLYGGMLAAKVSLSCS